MNPARVALLRDENFQLCTFSSTLEHFRFYR
jgi:hypothetical protein